MIFNKKKDILKKIIEVLCRNEYPELKLSDHKEWMMATSFSSPTVAGVSTLIIGEFRNKNIFNWTILRNTLKELALKIS